MDERIYYLGFSVFPGIGPNRFQKLLDIFGDPKSAWRADFQSLSETGFLNEALVKKFNEFRLNFDLKKFAKELESKRINFYGLRDLSYPEGLRKIKNPPIVIYTKGDFDFGSLDMQKCVGVVGARKITTYGEQVTKFIVKGLSGADCVVVSGLAIGVDSIAHNEALLSKGKTIAVLGSGVDICTPSSNQGIYEEIIKSSGAVISEFPPGSRPLKGSFPSRNRIIAGLCTAVIVTEGSLDSGALITANYSWQNNRKVFAVPGPITSEYSKGTNLLIKKGAIPATSPDDILSNLSIKNNSTQKIIRSANPDEQKIINLLKKQSFHVNEIIKQTNMSSGHVNMLLSIMEIKKLILNCGSGMFSLYEL